MWTRLGLGLALISGVACTAATASRTTAAYGEPTGRASNFINASEIKSAEVTDVYQVITRLRPMYLTRQRSIGLRGNSETTLEVYLDNVRLGGPSTLSSIPAAMISSIRYLSSSEATQRWGDRHRGDVIWLSTH